MSFIHHLITKFALKHRWFLLSGLLVLSVLPTKIGSIPVSFISPEKVSLEPGPSNPDLISQDLVAEVDNYYQGFNFANDSNQ